MYASLVTPANLYPEELDRYLENGWFRLGRNLFTTSFLTFQDSLFDALWLRVHLPDFVPSRSQRELLKKSTRFQVRDREFELTEEKEALFALYRESVSFQPAKNLAGILPPECTLFDSREVCIFDGDRLIACGVYDQGKSAAEGIVNFFDPEYKRFSLGKLLMLHKIRVCRENGSDWFYPGYVVPGYARFDYKLEISREHTEFYNRVTGTWQNTQSLNLKEQPLSRMVGALVQLEGILHSFGFLDFQVKRYRFYDIMLDPAYSSYGLITSPYFIYCFPRSGWEEVIITFDVFTESYRLITCKKLFSVTVPAEPHYYSEFLLREDRRVFAENNPFNFVFGLNKLLKRNIPTQEVKSP